MDGYVFFLAGSLMTMGALADRWGRRRLLLYGAGGYVIASVIGAMSAGPAMLIGSRMLLGVAGATLMPSTLSLIRSMFEDPRQRTLALGVWTASFALGGVVGPIVGGLLLRQFWWGSVLLSGVPAMLALIALGPRLLPEFRDPDPTAFDPVGAALSLSAVLLVVYGLKRLAAAAPGPAPLVTIVLGLVLGLLFVHRQRQPAMGAFGLHLLRLPAFTVPITANALSFFVLYGTQVLIAQYLQLVLGLSPLRSGLWTIPSALGYLAGSVIGSGLGDHLRPGHLLGAGLLVAAAGFGSLATMTANSGLATYVIGSVVFSIGLAPVYLVVTGLAISAAPVDEAGTASALLETATNLGGALGIAVLGSIAGAAYRTSMGVTVPAGTSGQVGETARETIGGAVAAARHLPTIGSTDLLDRARDAFVGAFRMVELVGVSVLIPTAVVAVIVLERVTHRSET